METRGGWRVLLSNGQSYYLSTAIGVFTRVGKITFGIQDHDDDDDDDDDNARFLR